MLLDDPRGPAEPLERAEPQDARSPLALDLPEPLHDDLEVGRLDPAACLRSALAAPRPRRGWTRAPVRTPASTASTSAGSIASALLLRARARAKRSTGPRIARRPRLGREVIEPQSVGEQPGEPPLERVEPRERVLADADRMWTGSSGRVTSSASASPSAGVAAVVDEVLLDLVEQQVDLAVLGGGDLDRVGQRAGLDRGSGRDGRGQRRRRGVRPGVADDDERLAR